jgi:hypothetical protein
MRYGITLTYVIFIVVIYILIILTHNFPSSKPSSES